MNHTPGPWEVGPYNNVHDTDTGESVAVVTDRHGEEANARLIAAAPELLEALQSLQRWAEMMGGWEAPAWILAKQAISKAMGGQS